MREVNETEVEVVVMAEDKLDLAIVDEIQISSTTITRKENTQEENVEEAMQAQSMINLKSEAIIVKRLAIMLQNVDSPRIELRRRLTMWSKKMRILKQCSKHVEAMKVAKKTHGTLTLVQATICSEKKSMFVDLDESVSGNVWQCFIW